jgi:hypothetical protein
MNSEGQSEDQSEDQDEDMDEDMDGDTVSETGSDVSDPEPSMQSAFGVSVKSQGWSKSY